MQVLNYMSKLSQRGAIHLIVPIILLLGIIGGVYLVTAGPLKFFPKASVSGPIGGVTYVDAKVGCGNPQGLTPDQICQQKGFSKAVEMEGVAAKGYWWRQCAGASVSNCDKLDCTVNKLDCTNTPGYWGSQQPYPQGYTKVGTTTTLYKPADFEIQACQGVSPGWTMRVACSLAPTTSSPSSPSSPPPSPSYSPSPSPVACTFNDLRAAFFARRGEPRYNAACDFNNDGRISVVDYSALLRRR